MGSEHKKKKRPLRILFVRFGSVAGTIGGGTIRLIQITRRWQKDNSVFVMTHKDTYLWQKHLGLTAKPFRLVKTQWTWIQNIPALIYCMIKILFLRTNERFDIVLSRSIDLVDTLPSIWISKQTGAKLAVHAGSDIIPISESRSKFLWGLVLINHFISCYLLRKTADIVNPFNEQSRDELIRLGLDPKNLLMLFGGFNLEDIKNTPPQEKHYDAIYLGRIAQTKGCNDLIDAWRLVCNIFPKVRLAIAGTGEPQSLDKLRRRIEMNKLENNTVFLGYVEESSKYQVLKSSRIFIIPSYVDTFSYSVAEALACGLPVVAYKLRAFQSVYGDVIVYAKLGDVSDLAKKIIVLLQDRLMQKEYSEKGRERVSKYNWDNAARFEIEALYSLLSSPRKTLIPEENKPIV